MQNSSIGHYQITETLGEGGMGVVYKGFAPAPGGGITVAIKMLLPSLAKEKNITERFLNEAGIMDRLRHTNVVRFHEFLELHNCGMRISECGKAGSFTKPLSGA